MARVDRTRALARAHVGRYLRSAVQRRSPELQCLRSPIWTVTQLMSHYRLSLAVSAPLPRRGREERPAAARNWRHEIERLLVGAPQPQPTHHEEVARTIVRRFDSALEVVRRRVRVVATSAVRREADPELARSNETRAVPAPRSLAEAALQPLPFARRAPAAEAPTAPALVGLTQPAAPSHHASTQAAAAHVAEHDIERLADRVIGSLDRRLVAQRERLGRH